MQSTVCVADLPVVVLALFHKLEALTARREGQRLTDRLAALDHAEISVAAAMIVELFERSALEAKKPLLRVVR